MKHTLDFISQHLKDDVRQLALQAQRYPDVDMPYAIDQIAGYQVAEQKLPTFAQTPGIQFPHHLSMEQCSSEQTARYKAKVIAELPSAKDSFVDLTAGFGIDFSFISSNFKRSIAIERQAYLCDIQRHNLALLGLQQASVIHADAAQFLQQMEHTDWLFLDPARRDAHGGKVVAIQDCEPNVAEWEDLLLERADFVMVKLSPMLDVSLAIHTLNHVKEVHIVAVNNECKELLFILSKNAHSTESIRISSINLTAHGEQTFSFDLQEESLAAIRYAERPSCYLYEPNAALIKAGAYRSIAQRFGMLKLHPNSHLYTSDDLIPDFPGRSFLVEQYGGFGKKELKTLLAGLQQANLTIRNFPTSVAELRKRLKLKDGGDSYLFATTLKEGEKVLIRCKKASNLYS